MKKRILLICCTIFAALMMTGCCLQHDWEEATCKDPMTCSKCGKTQGESLDHEWVDATCTDPKTCELCGKKKGDALGHDWEMATCTEPMTCKVCGATDGEAYGHSWSTPYSCTDERYCYVCGESDGVTGDHYWMDATCQEPETCYYCGATQGEVAGHDWQGTDYVWCWNCGESLPDNQYVSYDLSWYGSSFTFPSPFTLYKFDEENSNAFVSDGEVAFMVKTKWNFGFTYSQAIDVFRNYAEDVYVIEDEYEEEYNGYTFYVYDVYGGDGEGYCAFYWREDVFVYVELYGKDGDQIDDYWYEIMDTFEVL